MLIVIVIGSEFSGGNAETNRYIGATIETTNLSVKSQRVPKYCSLPTSPGARVCFPPDWIETSAKPSVCSEVRRQGNGVRSTPQHWAVL